MHLLWEHGHATGMDWLTWYPYDAAKIIKISLLTCLPCTNTWLHLALVLSLHISSSATPFTAYLGIPKTLSQKRPWILSASSLAPSIPQISAPYINGDWHKTSLTVCKIRDIIFGVALGSKEEEVWGEECFENAPDKNCTTYCILVEHTWTWRASSESCGEAWIFGTNSVSSCTEERIDRYKNCG